MKMFAITGFILIVVICCGSFLLSDTVTAPVLSDSVVVTPLPDTHKEVAAQPVEASSAVSAGVLREEKTVAEEIAPDESVAGFLYLEPEPPSTLVTLTISAAGDVTLGGDPRGSNQFIREFERNNSDHSIFLRNVRHIFEDDDLTIVNLEGALTEAIAHRDRKFVMRGPPHFSKILSSSGVDVVSLANNHTIDFFEKGYQDTVQALEAEDIEYFGGDFNTIIEIDGIRVGLFGFCIWYETRNTRSDITAAIDDLLGRGAQLIIAYYHWGMEREYMPMKYQRDIGRFTIDSGADLVLGTHPHVLQGIEIYNGKNIVYSLANFCFGGNNHPTDQDAIIFQQTFTFDDGKLQDTNETNIIPVLISSERYRNNFQPIIAEGADAERILQRLDTYSAWLAG